MAETGTDLVYAATLLRRGELVAIPTETVYGLAANALNSDAVMKIYATKKRPTFNPLIVHLAETNDITKYAQDIPLNTWRLAERFSPGPLTYVLPRKNIIPDVVTGGGDTVALRIPAHPMAHELLSLIDFPLAAPSANPSGYISPVSAAHVAAELGGKIPYVLDGGECAVGLESTVVAFDGDKVLVLRAGGVTLEALQEICPQVEMRTGASTGSPGLLKSHYAPRTRLVVGNLARLADEYAGHRLAVLALSDFPRAENIISSEILAANGDLALAARHLFTAMRRLDQSGADLIIAERMPEHGFGIAINDRLERASAE
ncbi:MAG: L-threonylcarbamoyladenylate synthase [Turneriella sp.]